MGYYTRVSHLCNVKTSDTQPHLAFICSERMSECLIKCNDLLSVDLKISVWAAFGILLFTFLRKSSRTYRSDKMSEINHEAIIIQIREGLQRNNIKLWLEPYCVLGESNEVELTVSRKIFTQNEWAFSHLSLFVFPRISRNY